jgi:hypothetical protein
MTRAQPRLVAAACIALLVSLVTVTPRFAAADSGELAVGAFAGATLPLAASAGLAGRVGLSDWFWVDARLQLLAGDAMAGEGAVGLVAGLDALSWVPEARLAAGARLDRGGVDPSVWLWLGVRRFLSLSWSLSLDLGAQWLPDAWGGAAAIGVWWAL